MEQNTLFQWNCVAFYFNENVFPVKYAKTIKWPYTRNDLRLNRTCPGLSSTFNLKPLEVGNKELVAAHELEDNSNHVNRCGLKKDPLLLLPSFTTLLSFSIQLLLSAGILISDANRGIYDRTWRCSIGRWKLWPRQK